MSPRDRGRRRPHGPPGQDANEQLPWAIVYLRRRGIQAVIPVKEDQKKNRRARGRSGGRPPAFDPGHYKERNTVERCFAKLKQFRAVATRYDKRDFMYQATVNVASIRIWLRSLRNKARTRAGRTRRARLPGSGWHGTGRRPARSSCRP